MKLSEHQLKDICKCEDCGHEPLSHFEPCPKCYSISYHKTTVVYTPETQQIKEENFDCSNTDSLESRNTSEVDNIKVSSKTECMDNQSAGVII